MRRFRALYGAGPLHLLALLASFALAGAAVVGWFDRPRDVGNVLVWFVAAIVLHDVVLVPLYSLLDRIAFGAMRKRADGARRAAPAGLVNPTPYLRIPAILSGLLLAAFFPPIFGLGSQTAFSASGIVESGYLARWLLATGVLLALSGVAYAVAVARAGKPALAGARAAAAAPGRPAAAPPRAATPAPPAALPPPVVGALPPAAEPAPPAGVPPAGVPPAGADRSVPSDGAAPAPSRPPD